MSNLELERDGAGRPTDLACSGSRVAVLLFAQARQAAGWGKRAFSATTVSDALAQVAAAAADPAQWTAVLGTCQVWVDGQPCGDLGAILSPGAEVAILPPVSGGDG